jgi:hypothetical protein
MILHFKAAIRALGLALLCTAPTALIFGYLTWSENYLFYPMVVIHCLGFIGAFVVFLLPEEKQWKFIRGFAAFSVATSKHQQSEDYQEILGEIDKLERKSKDEGGRMKDEEPTRRPVNAGSGDWGARKYRKDGKDGHGTDGHGDGETRRHGDE